MEIYQCPSCRRHVVGSLKHCKFCGAEVAPPPSPEPRAFERKELARFETPKWIWVLSYVAAFGWAFSNGFLIFLDLKPGAGVLNWLDAVLRLGFAVVGIVLVTDTKRARSWGNGAAGLCVIIAAIQLVLALLMHWGTVWTVALVINLGLAAATQWVISETAQNLWE